MCAHYVLLCHFCLYCLQTCSAQSGNMSRVTLREQDVLMQVTVRKDADGGSALMLYRKKPEEALQAAEPMFIAAPPAEAATEVCPTI